MRARVRSLGIILTIIFVGLVFYAGFMLFQLPNEIVDAISNETRNQVEETLRIIDNKDLTIKEKLINAREELAKPGSRRSEKIQLAEEATYSTIRAVGLMLLSGLFLMILIFAASFKTSAETIVYLDKKDDAEDEQENAANNQYGLLESIQDQLHKQLDEAGTWNKEGFEGFIRMLCTSLQAGSGILYQAKETETKREIELLVGYAVVMPDSGTLVFEYGEGLAGQVAKTKLPLKVSNLPEDYMTISSGLGEATPPFLTVLPIQKDGKTKGVLEIATFQAIHENDFSLLENFCTKLSDKFE
ncbi:MAG: GAF domain-containing protein [Flammeovirgaceae bacterium]